MGFIRLSCPHAPGEEAPGKVGRLLLLCCQRGCVQRSLSAGPLSPHWPGWGTEALRREAGRTARAPGRGVEPGHPPPGAGGNLRGRCCGKAERAEGALSGAQGDRSLPEAPGLRTGDVSERAHVQSHAEHPRGSGRGPSDQTCSVGPGGLAGSPARCALLLTSLG